LTRHHLENLAYERAYKNPDGSLSTIYTRQFETPDGVVVVPSVWDGKILGAREAMDRAMEEGVFEKFSTEKEASDFDRKIHEDNQILGGKMLPMSAADALKILEKFNPVTDGLLSSPPPPSGSLLFK
jgi:hypothetical protein